MKSITVEKLLGNNKNYQQVTGNEESLKRVILTGEINRPGFELEELLSLVIKKWLLLLR